MRMSCDGMQAVYAGMAVRHLRAPQQRGRLGQRQAHDAAVAAVDVLDPARQRALDRIRPGLAEGLAAVDVGLDHALRQRCKAHVRQRQRLDASRARPQAPPRSARGACGPTAFPASRALRPRHPACPGCGGRSPPWCPRTGSARPATRAAPAARGPRRAWRVSRAARRRWATRRAGPLRAPRRLRVDRAAAVRGARRSDPATGAGAGSAMRGRRSRRRWVGPGRRHARRAPRTKCAWGYPSLTVVGVPGRQRPRAVERLGQQHAREGMRQGQVRQAQRLVGAGLERVVQTVGPADHQRHVAPVTQPGAQALGQLRPSCSARRAGRASRGARPWAGQRRCVPPRRP